MSDFYNAIRREYRYVDKETGRAIRQAAREFDAQVKALPIRNVIGRQNLTVVFHDAWNVRPAMMRVREFSSRLAETAPLATIYN